MGELIPEGRAIVHFKKALELKPDYARAQYGIVKAYNEWNRSVRRNKNLRSRTGQTSKARSKTRRRNGEYRKKYQGELIAEPFKP